MLVVPTIPDMIFFIVQNSWLSMESWAAAWSFITDIRFLILLSPWYDEDTLSFSKWKETNISCIKISWLHVGQYLRKQEGKRWSDNQLCVNSYQSTQSYGTLEMHKIAKRCHYDFVTLLAHRTHPLIAVVMNNKWPCDWVMYWSLAYSLAIAS